MGRIHFFLQQIAILSTLLLSACVAPRNHSPTPIPPSTAAGIWLRPIAAFDDSTAVEGLYLLPDGRLHLVGIFSMNGLTWRARADSLTLATATERYPAADSLHYRVEKLDADSLVLTGPGYLGGRYRRVDSLPNTPLPRAQIAARLEHGHFMRGYLRMGHEVRSFTPCGSEVEYWVDDLTGANLYAVYRSLVSAPPADYAQLYVELDAFPAAPRSEGFAADYDSLLTATELRFAARETRGCADDLEGIIFRAQGNEPFWNLAINPAGIRVQQMGYETLEFPGHRKKNCSCETIASTQVYRAAIDTTHALMLRLKHQPCRDSMAGSYYHFTAELELDGHSLHGCARQGALPYK